MLFFVVVVVVAVVVVVIVVAVVDYAVNLLNTNMVCFYVEICCDVNCC